MKKRQVVVKKLVDESSGGGGGGRNVNSDNNCRNNRIRYGECQKNHAASIGGYAVDGCREFMASGCEGTPSALVCAACSCHRSFHKREEETM